MSTQEGRARRPLAAMVGPSVSVLIFLAVWLAVSVGNRTVLPVVNPVLLPTPIEVLQSGIDAARSGDLQRDILASMSRWRPLERLVEPMIEILRPIPPLAFLPMMVLWFGIGEMSKIAFITYAAFFPIFTTTVEGIKHVDPLLIRAASSLGASRTAIFRYVVLPAAMPAIITGLRLGFALSFFVIVAAEFLGADSGLGYLINDARTYFMVSQMLMGAAVIGIIGFTFNVLLRALEARLLRWRSAAKA
jgi:ABC-type nitrate/sulfonate/bicarbonate transport system permease component